MKYAILVGDGMADYPIKELDNRTPLEASRTLNMDWIAENGVNGNAITVPFGMKPGSDVANLSILGINPKENYTGRGPFEAASLGIDLDEDEVAFRCNFVTIADSTMIDYSAGHIKTNESEAFIKVLNKNLSEEGVRFHTGVSYRNLMIIKEELLSDGKGELKCIPPHDITDKKIKK